ncbi:NAD(P)/FAD-dependent oxidoreductase [Flavobacterium sp.]|uniref:NAD(P)/FAD-dependent oxidoreductase n=1 Tax=Flavobacterium sp. TaxID=239 RepID=UPI003B9AD889
MKPKIVIAGGGLAGLTVAIHLRMNGFNVTVIEKNKYPHHKMCGEYLSNEVVSYLRQIGVDVLSLQPKNLDTLRFVLENGKQLECTLPLGGLGISRFALDSLLYQRAKAIGVDFIFEKVDNISFHENVFNVRIRGDQTLTADYVLNALGKKSVVDVQFQRKHTYKNADWIAVKAHYKGDFPENIVGLYHFTGGYCGVSKIENNEINICFLAKQELLEQNKTISELIKNVLFKNALLREIFEKSTSTFEKPIAISGISFEKKTKSEKHILMIGDSAGLIHPLCGNGMAMAINSARLISEILTKYPEPTKINRIRVEKMYKKAWNKAFSGRLWMGRQISKVLQNQVIADKLFPIFVRYPQLLKFVIKQTHGKQEST